MRKEKFGKFGDDYSAISLVFNCVFLKLTVTTQKLKSVELVSQIKSVVFHGLRSSNTAFGCKY